MHGYKLLERLDGSLQRIDVDAFGVIHGQETMVRNHLSTRSVMALAITQRDSKND